MPFTFILRVDLDTSRDFDLAVSKLLPLLEDLELKATVFACTGPDKTGLNLFSFGKRAKRHFKVNPLRKFGVKNLFYGLILPPPQLEEKLPLLKPLLKSCELALHGYDHFKWAKRFSEFSSGEIERLVKLGLLEFTRRLGFKPKGFAPPCFKWNTKLLEILNSEGFEYSSCSIGKAPFNPVVRGVKLNLIEIPVSEPLIEDLVSADFSDNVVFKFFFKRAFKAFKSGEPMIMYFHPSFELGVKESLLRRVLKSVTSFNPWNPTMSEFSVFLKNNLKSCDNSLRVIP